MKTSRIAAAVLVAFVSSMVPLTALAQDDAVTMQARARFKEGVDFYDKGSYENARLAFLQAYALKKHPAVLLNLAQSSAKAGHPLEASKYFQQYQKESTSATAQQRQDADTGLAEVRQKLGRIEIVAPAGTEVTLDEKDRVGSAPFADPIDVEPGSHSLRSPSETVRVTANAGQKVQARFGAPPVVTPVPVPVTAPPTGPAGPEPRVTDPPPGGDTGSKRKSFTPKTMVPVYVGVTVAGVGLAGVIVFAVFKADAQSKADGVANEIRAKAGSRASGICTSTARDDINRFGNACITLKQNNDKVDTNATIANVSGVIAVVGAATALGWYLFAPKRDDATVGRASTPKPTVTPYAGYDSGGLLVSGSF